MGWIMKYWVEVFFSLATAAGAVICKKALHKMKEQEAIKFGVQALLRDRIYQAYFHHHEKGYYPLYARENVDALFHQYEMLGGNGTVHELVERLQELPVEKEEV